MISRFGLLFIITHKTWFKNKHFPDSDGDKPDTRFLLLGVDSRVHLIIFRGKI